MRIAIVGGGGAGLTAAWLLGQEHEVTLFERDARLGGHAHTVALDHEGRALQMEAGFEFFSERGWPTFCRLLGALGLRTRSYKSRLCVFRPGQPRARIMQPIDVHGRFEPRRLTLRSALDLFQFGLVLASAAPLMRARDTSVTLEQVLRRLPLDKSFLNELFFPFLLSCWCVEPEEFLQYSAYNALGYAFLNLSLRGNTPLCTVEGGLLRYPAAVIDQTPDLTLRTSTEVSSIRRVARGFELRTADGRISEVDHVVLATNARIAAQLLRDVGGSDKTRAQLERIEYIRTAIALHGDTRLMPARREDWSVFNARHDGRHAQATIWMPDRGDLFRSWITFDRDPPDALHLLAHYDHAKVTPAYFEAQRALKALSGEHGVWLAGVHMHGIDNHESAVCSAVEVVKRLAPNAPRLGLLAQTP